MITNAIECSLCLRWCHVKCAKLKKKEFNELSITENYWYCKECINIFPYNNVLGDEFIYLNSNLNVNEPLFELYSACKELKENILNQNDLESDEDELYNNEYNCEYYTNDEFNQKISTVHGLSIIHFNCRSLKANFSKLHHFMTTLDSKFDLIAVSETWLSDSDNVNEFLLEGYDMVRMNRKHKRGGGVMLYISRHINYEIHTARSFVINDVLETLSIRIINEKNKDVYISVMYRAPGGSLDEFNVIFQEFVSHFDKKSFILCGDFNINLMNNSSHKQTQDFCDTLNGSGLFPLISLPTRVTLNSSTLIDNIFTNLNDKNRNGVFIDDTVSDHLPIFTCLQTDCDKVSSGPRKILSRRFSKQSYKQFNNDLNSLNWDNLYHERNVNSAYDLFITSIKNLFEKNFPLKPVKVRYKTNPKPWLTKGLLKCCRRKNKLYKRFIKEKSVANEQKYKQYKNKLTKILRFSEKKYYTDKLRAHSDNMKETWKILNEIVKRKNAVTNLNETFISKTGAKITNKHEVANGFNDFFVNVGPKLADNIKIDETDPNIFEYMGNPISKTMFLKPVVEQEVLGIVNTCKNKTSLDCENLSMYTIKNIIPSIVKPFTYICNLSFLTGIFPDKLKNAKVIPLFKAGEKNLFTNYRPVSLLPQFSKILEKLFCKRLVDFIENNAILSKSQYGFRQKHSTSFAIMELVEEITSATDSKKSTIGVFIDLKKAFDTINHSILLKKLNHYGIRGISNDWLNSYMRDRHQFVNYNDVNSEMLKIVCGVPQGSILGPILFILYINDLCKVSEILKFVLFADDTNLFASGTDLKQLCDVINEELIKINVWFRVNKLSLNVSKTNFMIL